MHQVWGLILGEVGNTGFHDRPLLSHCHPGSPLGFFVDGSLDFLTIVGRTVIERASDGTILADRELQKLVDAGPEDSPS